jgi:SAM-dependent methyltransferase
VDASAELVAEARRRLPGWATRLGFAPRRAEPEALERDDLQVQVRWVAADAFDHAADPAHLGEYDLLLAHAFLDLVDARRAAQAFLPLLRPGGLFYFSLVFDGVTHFEPGVDPGLDAHIERLYHQTMDERTADGRPSGNSRTGRVLLRLLPEAGGQLLEAGSSDWVIFPRGRAYLPEEALLLQHILATVQRALRGHPELGPRDLQRWIECRQAQLERRELCYLAHQLDLFGSYLPPR